MAAGIDALEQLYRERFAGFSGALAALVGDAHVAEECVQAAFVTAVSGAASFRGGSLAAWVWRIAVNGAVDVHRRGLRLDHFEGTPWEALAGVSAPELPRRGDAAVRSALMTLSPRRRLVVFLRYHGDLSQREIAEVLGASEGTVAATLSQARAALRSELNASHVGGAQ